MSPNGYVHHVWWKRFLPVVGLMCAILLWWVSRVDFLVVVFLGYLLGYFIDPDLDQISITSAEGRMLKHFGCFGSLLVAYWFPYSKMFEHRSFLSHFPGISTAIRLLYLMLVPIIGSFALLYYYPEYQEIVTYFYFYLIAVWVGLTIADGVHYILDEVY